jgi:hypothetical protein
MYDIRLPDYDSYRLRLESGGDEVTRYEEEWTHFVKPHLSRDGQRERIMRWLKLSVDKVQHALTLVCWL